MSEPLGQILPGSLFGISLTAAARTSDTIVEIGTWKGQGSTLCLASGLIRPEQRMWTIESDESMWRLAQTFWNDPRIKFIHGKALDVLDQIPDSINLLLIDGADSTGFLELKALKERCGIIALDDTNELKNKRSRQLLIDESWSVILDYPEYLNGCSIFKRK